MDLFALAARQHGVVRVDQALELGITRSQLRTLERRGVIERWHPGVVRLRGHTSDLLQELSAATLWLPASVASHRGAANLHGLRGFEAVVPEIATERWTRRQRPAGLVLHETKDLVAGDITTVNGIACTSLVRTLVDLPAVVHRTKAGMALDQAARRDRSILRRVAERHREVARRGRNGTVSLRRLLDDRGLGTNLVDSGFERRALTLISDAGLPEPCTQWKVTDGVDTCYLDIAWVPWRVAMECDSLEFHLNEAAFRWERRRRRLLAAQGWTVLEFTYDEVTKDPTRVVRDLRLHLNDTRRSAVSTRNPSETA